MKWSIFLAFVSLTAVGQTTKIGKVTFELLRIDGKPKETIRGQVEVFEDNLLNKGKKIKLNIEVIPAKTVERKKEPMFIIMGGPGQAATDLVSFFSEVFEKINQKSDLVFIDQRGTGKSNPLQLNRAYSTLQDFFKDDFASKTTITKSFENLSRENNLDNYGTLNAIHDIEKVREEMGYSKVNLYGTSYGTRVSLAYINRYPKRVRTATLKGLVPSNLVIPTQFAEDAQRSLDLLIQDCKENGDCNRAYPDLSGELSVFFGPQFPVKVDVLNPETHVTETIQLTREIVALNLRVLLMAPSSAKSIPYLITEANKGNYEPLANIILAIKKSYIKGVYDGMMLCVICNEDYPTLFKINTESATETFLRDYWIYRIKTSCEIWNPEKQEPEKIAIGKQRTPVLIISGNRDAATPPKYGDEVLGYFPNGKHIVINQGGHSFDGLRNCVENIICDFVIAGDLKILKTDCIGSITFPEYKLN